MECTPVVITESSFAVTLPYSFHDEALEFNVTVPTFVPSQYTSAVPPQSCGHEYWKLIDDAGSVKLTVP